MPSSVSFLTIASASTAALAWLPILPSGPSFDSMATVFTAAAVSPASSDFFAVSTVFSSRANSFSLNTRPAWPRICFMNAGRASPFIAPVLPYIFWPSARIT